MPLGREYVCFAFDFHHGFPHFQTFGSRVLDWELAKSSFRVESIALLLAVAIGALIGIASSWAPIAEDWPTEEMASRGSAVGLATGVAIAIPRYVVVWYLFNLLSKPQDYELAL